MSFFYTSFILVDHPHDLNFSSVLSTFPDLNHSVPNISHTAFISYFLTLLLWSHWHELHWHMVYIFSFLFFTNLWGFPYAISRKLLIHICKYIEKRSRDRCKLIRSGREGTTTFTFYSILICVFVLNNKKDLGKILKYLKREYFLFWGKQAQGIA